MRAINRKLWRELWQMRGQVVAIALVVASGVATFIMARSTIDSLRATQAAFYSEYRFADAFATLKRAPMPVADLVRGLPGVETVEPRVMTTAKMDIAGFDEPVSGYFVSVPDGRVSRLNQLYIRQGRSVAPYRDDEVVISDGFAEAHGLQPSDQVRAIINGREKTFTIVGIALSPEFVYQILPGAVFPDFERYAIVWMGQEALSTALDMEGAFNDVALELAPSASPQRVIEELDMLLEPYGSIGAIERADQTSHNYLYEEFRQLNQMATVMPAIFLAVAAFLLNVVVSRLIRTQREEIAVLKAFGYSNLEVGRHYLKLVVLITGIGSAIGVVFGVWMGRGLGEMYIRFYRFPYLLYQLHAEVVAIALAISIGAAVVGTLYVVRLAVILPPAEAMRPEPPPLYRQTLVERIGLDRYLSQPARMIIRHLERKPMKAGLTIIGIASACAIIMLGFFFGGAVDHMIYVQLKLGQRDDLIVAFAEPTSGRVVNSIHGLEGVQYAEGFRFLDVELQHEHRSFRTNIQGLLPDGDLKRLVDQDLDVVRIPPAGLMITEHISDLLHVQPGDTLHVKLMQGRRQTYEVAVAAVIEQYIGQLTYMNLDAVNAMVQEGHALTGAYVSIDPLYLNDVYSELEDAPRVASLFLRESGIEDFYETTGENWLMFAFIITALAGVVAFGVIYNSARIALSERSRELASLRILGLTRGEISFILIGELVVLALIAIPVGFLMGWGLCAFTVLSLQTEMFTIPLVMENSTYAYAALIVVASAALSAWVVRRRLNRLNLIGVLKTRE